jgi:hypothetical protein
MVRLLGSMPRARTVQAVRLRQRPCGPGARTLLTGALACGPLIEERDRNIRAAHEVALLEGYKDYETRLSDMDTGIVWFEYRLPDSGNAAGIAATIATRIRAREPCYRMTESAASSASLRCADPNGDGFEEYRVKVIPKERLVVVMHASIQGHAEHQGYRRFVQEFEEQVSGR